MKRKSGFSLIELMVIIAIVAILSSFVAFSIPSWRARTSLKTFSRNLRSDIVFAKSEAVKLNQRFGIRFDFGANRYTIQRFDAPTDDWAETFKQVEVPGGVKLIAAATTFAADPKEGTFKTLIFSGRGVPIPESLDPPLRLQGAIVVEGLNKERRQVLVTQMGSITLERL